MKKLGLRMVLWVATVLLNGQLDREEKDELESIKTKLNISDIEL